MTLIPDSELLETLEAAGQQVTVGGQSIYAIYENAYAEDLEMAGTQPRLKCRTVDVAAVVDGTAVVAGGLSYLVRGNQPQRTGLSVLVLELQS